jgi:5-methyltetrahydropteroyltriglutamate--homocysteine methyltransferase
MERLTPPYRADHVGSLIRPASLVEAHREHLAGRMPKDALRALQDKAIREVVALQEEIGLRSITDGEFRRTTYLSEFLNPIGVELIPRKSPDLVYHDGQGGTAPATYAVVNGKIKWTQSINVEPFAFLKSITKGTPKVTIPAPTQVHFFAGTTGISKAAYPDVELFWNDMIAAYHAELAALGAAGCTYVQIDETCIPKLADPAIQQVMTSRGWDWRGLVSTYVDVMNRIIRGAPQGMTVAVHHCRGNNAGMWQAQAGYEAVAEIMFATLEAKAYLLEFDSKRAGDFAPLRFMPKDKVAVLGLVSTKSNRIESADELKERIEEASKVMPLDRLCLGPQCGFSCGFAGSDLTYDSELKKLGRIVEVARAVWNA